MRRDWDEWLGTALLCVIIGCVLVIVVSLTAMIAVYAWQEVVGHA